jgi:hypothetical protein
MKMLRRTPHFLRVTQALALASGLTVPLACGGQVQGADDAGEVPDAGPVGMGISSAPDAEDEGNGLAADSGPLCMGICEAPDAADAGNGLEADSAPICTGICEAPDALFEPDTSLGIAIAPDSGSPCPSGVCGIVIAPDAGLDTGRVEDAHFFPGIGIAPDASDGPR